VRTLKEVLAASDLLRQRALSLALSFVITGVVRRPGEAEGPAEAEAPAEVERPAAGAVDTGGAGGAGGAVQDQRVNAELLFMRAKNVFNEGDFQTSSDILREITELNPLEGEYWAWLGWAIFNLDPGRIKEAEKIIKDSIDINNELDSAWFFLGNVSLAHGNFKGAETAFKTAYTKNPWMLDAVSELKRLEIIKGLEALPTGPGRAANMDAFGLAADPFTEEPIERFFSSSSGQANALEFLVRGVKKKAGPLLLEGVKGAGKTTLVLELLKKLSNTKTLAASILDPPDKELQLIRAINAELNSSTETSSIKEQLLSLGMRISQNKIQSGHTVIIIDEAHTLTDGCLKLVQYLARLKSLQIILLSEPGMGARLATPPFKELDDKVLARSEIRAFTEQETRAYVDKRLSSCPGRTGEALGDEVLLEICAGSSGVPGLINVKAAEALASAAGRTGAAVSLATAEEAPAQTPEALLETLGEELYEPEAVEEEEKEEEGTLLTLEPIEPRAVEKGEGDEGRAEAGGWPVGEPVEEKEAAGFSFEAIEEGEEEEPREEKPQFEFEPFLEEKAAGGPVAEAEAAPEGAEERAAEGEEILVVGKGGMGGTGSEVGGVGALKEGAVSTRIDTARIDTAEEKRKRRKKSEGRGVGRLLFWVVMMLLLGLITGSLIGLFWFDKLGFLP
jgi:type II secretory pathway predicted ATPase ExeA